MEASRKWFCWTGMVPCLECFLNHNEIVFQGSSTFSEALHLENSHASQSDALRIRKASALYLQTFWIGYHVVPTQATRNRREYMASTSTCLCLFRSMTRCYRKAMRFCGSWEKPPVSCPMTHLRYASVRAQGFLPMPHRLTTTSHPQRNRNSATNVPRKSQSLLKNV